MVSGSTPGQIRRRRGYLLGRRQQLHRLFILGMLDEEVRAAREEGRVGVFVQVLGDELKSGELFSGEGQL